MIWQGKSAEEVKRIVGGRNRWNAHRRMTAGIRRYDLVQLLKVYRDRRRGYQAEIAKQLGVSSATICRDLKAIEGEPCPTCGAWWRPRLRILPIKAGLSKRTRDH